MKESWKDGGGRARNDGVYGVTWGMAPSYHLFQKQGPTKRIPTSSSQVYSTKSVCMSRMTQQ